MTKLPRLMRWSSLAAFVAALGATGAIACSEAEGDSGGAEGGTAGVSGAGATSGGSAGTPATGGAGGFPTGGVSSGGTSTGGSSGAGTGGAGLTGGSAGSANAGTGNETGGGGNAGSAGSGTAGGGNAGGAGGSGGAAGGRGGAAGKAGSGGSAGTAGTGAGGSTGNDPKPYFSFFVTSMAGLLSIAPDTVNGFGGDLRFGEATGLAGADKICTTLARRGSPGDTKVWRAFLSTTGFMGGQRVDAIDRVGPGPWYDFNGRLLASNVAGLMPAAGASGGRPAGNAQLVAMFTDENGVAASPNGEDNHDTLTGSNPQGRVFGMTDAATCQDWTSKTARGQVPVGHSWPRSASNGRQWIQDHTVNGCEPGIDIDGGGGAPMNNYTVGGGGGYGGIYCFALGAVAP
jgi:hypothetical protein